ncbi:MAG: hypothetical protein GX605_09350, partial [Chloroflexi bacterium]|nr:hypothetical protein [Chloroflexota bacterium]
LPYQVNKARLVERIAELSREGRLEGIADLRDESDRTGMRLVVELTRTVDARVTLKRLFDLTPLKTRFGVTMLALVEGEPRLLPLRKILQLFLEHRQEIVRRRSEYDLARARARAHILEGLRIALANLQEVIETIRRSRTAETARNNLQAKFKLSELQAQAILDMPLRRIAALERQKIEEEYKELLREIAHLEDLLAHPEKILQAIRQELQDLKKRYVDPRRTQIVDHEEQPLTAQELLPDQTIAVALSEEGALTRWALPEGQAPDWKTLLRDATGSPPLALCVLNTRQDLLLVTAKGTAGLLQAHRIPENGGAHCADLSNLTRRDRVVALAPFDPPGEDEASPPEGYLFLATAQGQVKRVALAEARNAAARGAVTVMGLADGDQVIDAVPTDGKREVLLVSTAGRAIRFAEGEVRAMGLPAGGVAGIKLAAGDQVASLGVAEARSMVLVVTQNGFAKRSEMKDYPTQGRNGTGVATVAISKATGSLVGAAVVKSSDLVLARTSGKGWSAQAGRVAKQGRATRGTRLALPEGEKVLRLLVAPSNGGAKGS